MSTEDELLPKLLPCPFCGGPVKLELAHEGRSQYWGYRKFWGVVCRNTINEGSCAMEQRPSASKVAAVNRWNMRGGIRLPENTAKTNQQIVRERFPCATIDVVIARHSEPIHTVHDSPNGKGSGVARTLLGIGSYPAEAWDQAAQFIIARDGLPR